MNLKNNWLKLSENTAGPRYIVNSEGMPFQMFGMARCQICAPYDEDPVYNGIDKLAKHFKKLGCNSMRLAIALTELNKTAGYVDYVEECGGYNEKGIQNFITKYVDPDLQAIISNGMYVLLDLHDYPPNLPEGDPDTTKIVPYAREHYIPIWAELAKRYKDEPMIATFEIWNEPYPADQGGLPMGDDGHIRGGKYHDYDWNYDVRQFYIDCIDEVRKYDTKHIILASDYNAGWGTGWAMTWLGHVQDVDSVERNTMFSIHVAEDHVGPRIRFFDDWWASICTVNNIGIQFGEIETEEDLMTTKGIENLVTMFEKRADTHHYAGFLWRPHTDESNYVPYWTEFAKKYSTKI